MTAAAPSEGAAQLMQEWLAQLGAVRGASPKTLVAYRRDVAGYLGFLARHWGGPAGGARLAAVSTEDLRAWMAHERGRGLSARSLARGLSAVKSFHVSPRHAGCRRRRSAPPAGRGSRSGCRGRWRRRRRRR